MDQEQETESSETRQSLESNAAQPEGSGKWADRNTMARWLRFFFNTLIHLRYSQSEIRQLYHLCDDFHNLPELLGDAEIFRDEFCYQLIRHYEERCLNGEPRFTSILLPIILDIQHDIEIKIDFENFFEQLLNQGPVLFAIDSFSDDTFHFVAKTMPQCEQIFDNKVGSEAVSISGFEIVGVLKPENIDDFPEWPDSLAMLPRELYDVGYALQLLRERSHGGRGQTRGFE